MAADSSSLRLSANRATPSTWSSTATPRDSRPEEAADAYTAEKEAAAQAELDRLKAEEEAKKAEEEAATAEPPKENKITKYAGAFLGIVALIALAAGGGFYFYRQQMQKKKAEKEALDPDADYTEDKGDFEIPMEDEPEEPGKEDMAEE